MNTVLILSGGVGSRVNSDIPKQYIDINGHMMISRCIEAVLKCSHIDCIHITAAKDWQEAIKADAKELIGDDFLRRFRGFSVPGENRQLSIYNGLKDIASYSSDDDIVIVHDAARPLVSEKLLTECIEACEEHDGVMPALPMKDTVYMSENGKTISSLLERSKIYAGQAPEAFRLGMYLRAIEALLPEKILKINGSSEPAIMYGMDIAIIKGDEGNFKITTDNDLKRYKDLIEKQRN
ncbi:MAG: 2-C-methyl-D-erythritol 4-phosphate cytidylyltransferase [Lachnospiraceae bacterium]|nr:2-C-methyl-D-erythritol 4-phosphate cytidylyltransferase [Lachnospiraceae bacterium]